MKMSGKICLALLLLAGALGAQERSVEDSYLQDSAEITVIRDLAQSSNRDLKTMALDYIGGIIERGGADDEVRKVLASLTMDGVRNQIRLGGRVVNNFPDLRTQAVNYLAKLGTKEAKGSLISVVELSIQPTSIEEDPSVITAAIKGLAAIGLSDDGDSLRYITAAFNRYNNLKPDNALALAVVNAIETFRDKGIQDDNGLVTLMTIQANYTYVSVVRARAGAVIEKFRGSK